MRLNIGCGQFPVPGWVNVDLPAAVEHYGLTDVTAGNVLALPFEDDTALQVYCGHVLEHIDVVDFPQACSELRRVMAPGAQLCVVGPDIELAEQIGDEQALADIRNMGGPWEGAGHKWLPTRKWTAALLRANGFEVDLLNITSVPIEWPVVSRVMWQFALMCR